MTLNRRLLVASVFAWLAVLAVVGAGLHYVDQRDAERSREICGLIKVTDDAYRANPPTTPTGRSVAAAMHAYRLRIGC